MGTGRLESFSDGVLAVIITIMAFELKTPISSNVHALSHRLPLLLVYVLSFAFIGIYWVNHHHLLHATRLISAGVMWANLYLLFWLSLIPFVTAWVGAQHSASLPAACYAIVANGSGLAFRLLSSAIRRANPKDQTSSRILSLTRKENASTLLYTSSIGLAFLSPYIAYASFVIVAILWFVPDRRLVA
jgi:uncharacterized membrane protein